MVFFFPSVNAITITKAGLTIYQILAVCIEIQQKLYYS